MPCRSISNATLGITMPNSSPLPPQRSDWCRSCSRNSKIAQSFAKIVEFLLKQDVRRLKLNNHYFYQLLFTRVNLSLVHISCHDKKEHSRNRLLRCTKASHLTLPAVEPCYKISCSSSSFLSVNRYNLARMCNRRTAERTGASSWRTAKIGVVAAAQPCVF